MRKLKEGERGEGERRGGREREEEGGMCVRIPKRRDNQGQAGWPLLSVLCCLLCCLLYCQALEAASLPQVSR